MIRFFSLLLLAGLAIGQTTTVNVSVPVSVVAGNVFPIVVSCTGCNAQSVAALQWTFNLPIGMSLATSNVVATIPTGDTGQCGLIACLISGTQTILTDGSLITFNVMTVSSMAIGAASINLSGIFAATNQGFNVNGMTAGPAASIKVLSPCDLNSDGSINAADVQLVVNGVINGASSCPISSALGGCTVVTVIQEIIAATGGACKI